jgi:phage baseplate assembly protein W
MSGRHLAFPFAIAADGRSHTLDNNTPVNLQAHIKGEVLQLLLTNPGERPLQPLIGGGLRRLVFEGNSDATAAVAKATINRALNDYLGHRIEIMALEVKNNDATLLVGLQYRIIATGEEQRLRFEHSR